MSVEMQEIKGEQWRVYEFPNGQCVKLDKVTHLGVRLSGTHRLRTADGLLHIVPPGWLHITIGADDWTL